jgi:TolA-binding protein
VISKSALALFLSVAASLLSQNTWAILSDDEARRAILELRKSVSASQAAILDLQNQLDKHKSENAQLRGQIESLQKQSDDLSNNQKSFYQDLDARISRLEPQNVEVEGVTGIVQAGEKSSYDEALKSFQAGQIKNADSEFTTYIRPLLETAKVQNSKTKT